MRDWPGPNSHLMTYLTLFHHPRAGTWLSSPRSRIFISCNLEKICFGRIQDQQCGSPVELSKGARRSFERRSHPRNHHRARTTPVWGQPTVNGLPLRYVCISSSSEWVWWDDEGLWHRQTNGVDEWLAPECDADSDWIYSTRQRQYFVKYANGAVVWHGVDYQD